MTTWSSPFPVDWSTRAYLDAHHVSETAFPGPPGTVVIMDSPDRLLANTADLQIVLQDLELQYQKLIILRDEGQHSLQTMQDLKKKWNNPTHQSDQPCPLIAMLLIQCASSLINLYDTLQPGYSQCIEQASTGSTEPLEQWIQMRFENQRLRLLLEQHHDQQRRSMRLLTELLSDVQQESSQSDA
jgi:hypothetical protein